MQNLLNTTSVAMPARLTQPKDPYDTEAWLAFYAKNPGWRRSVGAEGINDDDEDNDKDKSKNDEDNDKDKSNNDDDPELKKLRDEKAELLKDMMKHKENRQNAEKRVKELEDKLGDIDLDEYKRLKTAEDEAASAAAASEEKRLLEQGDFEKIKQQMLEAHEKEIKDLQDKNEEIQESLNQAKNTIDELTIGASFSSSKFIAEDTIFPASKARTLFGSHFEVVEGKIVAYDKPKGKSDRAPLVNGSGENLDFEDALRKIVESDPDKEDILRAKMKPGAKSKNGDGKLKEEEVSKDTRSKITDGVKDLMKNMSEGSKSGIKL